MKLIIRETTFVRLVAVLILLYASGTARAQPQGSVRLNENAFAFAEQLIGTGQVIADRKGAWREHRPSTAEENEFIRVHGFSEYAKWHLGIDERYGENRKARYKFPYGDFKNVHRCGLLAVRARAGQYGYAEIAAAATKLQRAIKDKSVINTDFQRFKNSSVRICGVNSARPLRTR